MLRAVELQRLTFALAATVIAAAIAVADVDQVAVDEATLRAANIATDGPSLLEYFRAQTVSDADLKRIDALVNDLGDPLFRKRQQSTAALLKRGPAALPALRHASRTAEPEIAQRAAECVRQIEESLDTALLAAAARLLAVRRPPEATAVLLAYLPTAEELVADEIRTALTTLARDSPADKTLRAALTDPHPVRRAAAGAALAGSGTANAVDLARPLSRDPDPAVRLRTSLGLVTARDRAAVPVLIDLLGELPPEDAWPAEELLQRLAGDDAPGTPLGTDADSRKKCRDDWSTWWTAHADTADFARLTPSSAPLGLTVVAHVQSPANGTIVEIGPDRLVRRSFTGLGVPYSLQCLPNDRLLIAEYTSGRITERDLDGKVLWEKAISQPIACQRLPGGHTLIATRNKLLEIDRDRQQVWSNEYGDVATIAAAARRRDGKIVVIMAAIEQKSRCVILDARGQELKSFLVGRCQTFAGIDVLPSGRILIPEPLDNRVSEYDADGQRTWSVPVEYPTSATRLPNGHILVVSGLGQYVGELGRSGRIIWRYKLAEGQRPLLARPR
jgi:hypothetical protein